MIDKISILVPHLVLIVALWRLLGRADLDSDPAMDTSPPGIARSARRASTADKSAPDA